MNAQPSRRTLLTAIAGGAISLGSRANAAPADFYRGKSVNLIVGFAPGGGVDTTTRVVGRHLARFIPGAPRVIVQNMEGAAGIVASNYLYQRVAADGLTIGVPGRSWFVEGAIRVTGVRFDPEKFSYIGSPGAVNSVVFVRSSTGVKNFADLKSAKKPLTFGALGNLTPTAMVPFMLAANGLPIRVVVGYVSSARIIVALEQGEVDGFFTIETSFGLRRDLMEKKVIVPILQNKPIHPGVPLIRDVLPKSDGPLLTVVMAMETFGLPLIGPPGIPADRLETLRSAFLAMCRDKEYQADAVKADLPVGNPLSGAQLAGMMKELVMIATPEIIARYKRLGTPSINRPANALFWPYQHWRDARAQIHNLRRRSTCAAGRHRACRGASFRRHVRVRQRGGAERDGQGIPIHQPPFLDSAVGARGFRPCRRMEHRDRRPHRAAAGRHQADRAPAGRQDHLARASDEGRLVRRLPDRREEGRRFDAEPQRPTRLLSGAGVNP